MNDEHVRKMIDDKELYEAPREDTLRSMLSDFYSRKTLSVAVLVWTCALVFMALAVVSAVLFFDANDTKPQILYATVFLCLIQWVGLMKIFAWQTIHKNSIKREIKRLEIRLAEACSAMQKGSE